MIEDKIGAGMQPWQAERRGLYQCYRTFLSMRRTTTLRAFRRPIGMHPWRSKKLQIGLVSKAIREQLRRSLTWDQGTEMPQDGQLRMDAGIRVYFDPQSRFKYPPGQDFTDGASQ